jgi:hypothetical protein
MLNLASLKIARAAAVLTAALLLCAPQPAKAGGGADLASLQSTVNEFCGFVGVTTNCPQMPTIAQAILQVAAFGLDSRPEAVRAANNIPVGPYIDAGNSTHPLAVFGIGCSQSPCPDPLNPIAGLPIDPSVLSSLRPLAFVGASSGGTTATPTQLYDRSATAYLYAVGGLSAAAAAVKPNSPPDTMVLFYDDVKRTQNFSQGQVVGKVSLPLTVLNKDGSERAVPTVLTFTSAKQGTTSCQITGNFGNNTQTVSAGQIGVGCAIVVESSPANPAPHAIFEVTVPMLITPSNDPLIVPGGFYSAPFFPTGAPGFKLTGVQSIGIAPNAAPLGPPATVSAGAPFALCASLATDLSGNNIVPSVAAFYAIANDGEVLTSSPLAPGIPTSCPAL